MEQAAVEWFIKRGLICTDSPNIVDRLDFEPTIRLFGQPSVVTSSILAYSYVGPLTALNLSSIGRYCSIGDRCTIGPSQHPSNWLTTSPIVYKSIFGETTATSDRPAHEELAPVTIGSDVWIGASTAVMGGVTVGHGAIIGYGSVVTKDVPPYAIVAGAPARLIRMRFPEPTIERLLDFAWWRYDLVQRNETDIRWQSPLEAIDDIQAHVAEGKILEIPDALHRIPRWDATNLSFTKLR